MKTPRVSARKSRPTRKAKPLAGEQTRKAPEQRSPARSASTSQPATPTQTTSDLDALIAQAKAREVTSAGGRPSLYRPEWCDVVVALAQMGKGLNHLSRLLMVNRDTISEWQSRHCDFSEACRLARAIRASVLEDALEGQARAHDVNWRLRVLANIAADDFRDRADLGVGGRTDAPPVAVANLDIADMVSKWNLIRDDVNNLFNYGETKAGTSQ
jgi:hypothetical protein